MTAGTEQTLTRRYQLRREAAAILRPVDHRTCSCGTARSVSIDILTGDTGSTFFAGVETCGSVWTCPVCGGKIMRKRAEEVSAAVNMHTEGGGNVYFLTLTAPHLLAENCITVLDRVRVSWRKLLAGNPWKRIRERHGISDYIRAVEPKHGRNGWHIHIHALLFTDRPADLEMLKWSIFDRWERIVRKADGSRCSPKAIDLQPVTGAADSIGEYLNKVSLELTELHLKGRGAAGSATPFQLLDKAAAGCRRSRRLFREYAEAFKGARHLTWSRGTKAKFGLVDLSDDEAAASTDQCHVAARVDIDEYRIVRTYMREADLLIAAKEGGQAAVDHFLASLGLGEETAEHVSRRAAYWGERSYHHHDQKPPQRRIPGDSTAQAKHRTAETVGA